MVSDFSLPSKIGPLNLHSSQISKMKIEVSFFTKYFFSFIKKNCGSLLLVGYCAFLPKMAKIKGTGAGEHILSLEDEDGSFFTNIKQCL